MVIIIKANSEGTSYASSISSLDSTNFLNENEIHDIGVRFDPSLLRNLAMETPKSRPNIVPKYPSRTLHFDSLGESPAVNKSKLGNSYCNSETPQDFEILLVDVQEKQTEVSTSPDSLLSGTDVGQIDEGTKSISKYVLGNLPTEDCADLSNDIAKTTNIKSGSIGVTYYGFDIDEVLNSSESVRQVIQLKVPQNKFILRCDRQVIAAVLIDAVIIHLGTSPSKQALEQLAKTLVNKYPTFGDPRRNENGWEMWFYHTPYGPGATGFLEDRLKNQRKLKQVKKTTKPVQLNIELSIYDWKSECEDEDPEPDLKLATFMKHNFGPEITGTMKETVFGRRTYIRRVDCSKDTGLQQIMAFMPRLFDTEGMIVQDFNSRHPSLAYVIYQHWPTVSKLILDYAEQSGISYTKRLGVQKPRLEFTDGDCCIIALCLLPFVLPSCGRKPTDYNYNNQPDFESPWSSDIGQTTKKRKSLTKTGPPKKNLKTVKASDLECLRSLILFKPKNTHVADVLSENKRKAPFILALGSSIYLQVDSYFLIIHKVAVPCGSEFLVALDTCFKCFTVLGVPFPLESYDHWVFIDHGVARKPYNLVSIPPVVQALIGQICSKM